VPVQGGTISLTFVKLVAAQSSVHLNKLENWTFFLYLNERTAI